MTTSGPNPPTQRRGRHARSDDYPEQDVTEPTGTPQDTDDAGAGRAAAPPADPRARDAEPAVDTPPAERSWFRSRSGNAHHALGLHPAGTSLLLSSGLLAGLALAPVVFGQLDFDITTRAARAARSAAAPWPAGSEPWFWPPWVALLAGAVAVVLAVLALVAVRLPDVVVLVLGVVLAVTTARAAWATLDVVNSRLWDLLAVCLVCLLAFGLAVSGAAHWRSPDEAGAGGGAGNAAGMVGAGLVLALLLIAGGATIAKVQESGLGAAGPPRDVAGLLSTRSADSSAVDDLGGAWVPQLAAAEIPDDAAATAFSARHRDWTARFPVLLVRGDDVRGDLGETSWLTVVDQRFASEAEAQAWCAGSGVTECSARQLAG